MATPSAYVFTASSPVFAGISRIVPDAKWRRRLLDETSSENESEVAVKGKHK